MHMLSFAPWIVNIFDETDFLIRKLHPIVLWTYLVKLTMLLEDCTLFTKVTHDFLTAILLAVWLLEAGVEIW